MSKTKNIKSIILVGRCDFGRCLIASRLLTALWPVAGKPVLECLLAALADQGIKDVVVGSESQVSLLKDSIQLDARTRVKFLDESLPTGPAGCIRNAAKDRASELLVVFSASIVCPPDVELLLAAHRDGQSDMTVMFNPSSDGDRSFGEPAEIYVCEPNILENIPKGGYFDIKEGLIPELLRVGKSVHAAILMNHVGNFRDRQGYLCAISSCFEGCLQGDAELKLYKNTDSQKLWLAENVSIDPDAKFYGQVAIMERAKISKDAVIFGPTMIGRNVDIGQGSVVINSALWDNSHIGPNCQIQRCIIDYNATIPRNAILQEKSVPFKAKGILRDFYSHNLKVSKNIVGGVSDIVRAQLSKIDEMLPTWVKPHKSKIFTIFAGCLVLATFIWSYWHNLIDLWSIWQKSDEYSSGLFVPFLSVYILWSRRQDIAQCKVKPSFWGLFAFVAAQAFRLFGLFFMFASAERLSIALSIAALVLLLFGWQLFRRVFTILLFLFLMLPWPNRVQTAVTLPLQRWSTSSAVFCLEMIGYEVVQEGNIIHIGDSSVAVAEACNGLRMITAFFVISGLVVLLIKRAWWEKLIVLASSLPIALLCNTVRLAITAMFFTVISGEYWEKVFHDFGGYAMMPLALAVVVIELWLLTKLTTVPAAEEETIVVARRR